MRKYRVKIIKVIGYDKTTTTYIPQYKDWLTWWSFPIPGYMTLKRECSTLEDARRLIQNDIKDNTKPKTEISYILIGEANSKIPPVGVFKH